MKRKNLTAAVGDSDNDRSMILAAGVGFVVSNANDSLKADADEIICSNDEHAMAWIYNQYFEKN